MAASRANLRLLKTSDFTPEGTESLYRLFTQHLARRHHRFLKPMSRKRAQEYFESLKARHPYRRHHRRRGGGKTLDGFGLIRRDEASCSGIVSRWFG